MNPRTQRLLDAHSQLLAYGRGLATNHPLNRESVGRWVSLAIYMRLLHLAGAVQRLAEAGYVDAAEPILRAMSCAVVNMLTITDEQSNRRSLAFLEYVRHVRHRWLQHDVEQGVRSQDEANAIAAEADDHERRVVAEYAANGVEAARLGNNTGYWSGLPDRQLFHRVGKGDWYDYYYSPTSDAAHSSVSALGPELRAARDGRLEMDARDSDPEFVLMASMNMLGFAIAAIDNHFDLGQANAVQEARARADAATAEAIMGGRGAAEG